MDDESDFTARPFEASHWRQVLPYARPYRRPLLSLAIAGVAIALIDAVVPRLVGFGIDRAVAGRPVAAVAGGYAACYAVLAAAIYLFIAAAGRAATGIGHDLRRDAFARLQSLSFAYYDRRSVGWLVTRLTSDCNQVASLIPWFLLDLVWGPMVILSASVMMFTIDVRLAGTVILVVPLLAGASLYFQRRLLATSRAVRRWNSKVTAEYSESLVGVRTIKMLGHEPQALATFATRSAPLRRASVDNALHSALYLPTVTLVAAVGVGLALWFGGLRLGQPGRELSLGELIAFLQYAAVFAMPVQDIARRFADLQAAQAAVERVTEILAQRPSIADSPQVLARMAEQQGAPAPGRAPDGLSPQVGELCFEAVDFAYEPDKPVLRALDLRVPPGQTVALVGPTGGGKSTIVSLLARYYEVSAGRITQAGVDIRARSLHWWQSRFGVVLQTPHLFSGTVAENIAYGRPTASMAEIVAAARAACADEFIAKLPEGYDSPVGPSGERLSVGQRQLLAIARTLLCEPEIVILDEATASIDTETERRIQVGIDSLLRERTAFVVAHRLSTIEGADRILFVADGKIVEDGRHDQLMAQGGRYAALRRLHSPLTASE